MDLSSLLFLNQFSAVEVQTCTVVSVVICGHHELYDTTLYSYTDQTKMGSTWVEVTEEVELPGNMSVM